MTPIRNCITQSETNYNKSHIVARNSVERCIGVLKNRLRCILGERGLHYEPEKITKIINVCCAIHNVCIQRNESNVDEFENTQQVENHTDAIEENVSEADAIRRRIIDSF